MEKLIELLNEYQKAKEKSEQARYYEMYKWELDSQWGIVRYDTDDPREGYNLYSDVTPSYLTSKSFGFIKWLVENDKIDFKTFGNAFGTKYLEYPIGSDNYDQVYDYKDIIKWLSISDTPIEDLISYLR